MITPGDTALTLTPLGANSRATQRVNWSRAALETQYANTPGKERWPLTLRNKQVIKIKHHQAGFITPNGDYMKQLGVANANVND